MLKLSGTMNNLEQIVKHLDAYDIKMSQASVDTCRFISFLVNKLYS